MLIYGIMIFLCFQEVKTEVLETSEIVDRLPQAMVDAKISVREAFEESVKRWKAEEDAMDAIHKVKDFFRYSIILI